MVAALARRRALGPLRDLVGRRAAPRRRNHGAGRDRCPGVAAVAFLRSRARRPPAALRTGVPLELAAVIAASLPFIVAGGSASSAPASTRTCPSTCWPRPLARRRREPHRGRLPARAAQASSRRSPLGPSLVHAFDGLALAVAVAMPRAPGAPVAARPGAPDRRLPARRPLVHGRELPGPGRVQGSIEALLVLAFAIGLHQISTGELTPAGAPRGFAAAPLAVLGVGAVYCYSFPGLLWLGGAAAIWAAAELATRPGGGARSARPATARGRRGGDPRSRGRSRDRSHGRLRELLDLRPEGGRPRQPLQPHLPARGARHLALGRLPRRARWWLAPAFAFWLGAALAAAVLAWGLAWWLRRRELAVPAALAAAALLILYALVGGTPYQEAKAIVDRGPAGDARRRQAALVEAAAPSRSAAHGGGPSPSAPPRPPRLRWRSSTGRSVRRPTARSSPSFGRPRRALDARPRLPGAARRRARARLPRLGASGRKGLRRGSGLPSERRRPWACLG